MSRNRLEKVKIPCRRTSPLEEEVLRRSRAWQAVDWTHQVGLRRLVQAGYRIIGIATTHVCARPSSYDVIDLAI